MLQLRIHTFGKAILSSQQVLQSKQEEQFSKVSSSAMQDVSLEYQEVKGEYGKITSSKVGDGSQVELGEGVGHVEKCLIKWKHPCRNVQRLSEICRPV